jgi:hypothetical protein
MKKGFLHPILVTEHDDYWILADGTHRKKALEQLGCKFIPALIIKESLRRDTWVRLFNGRMQTYKNVYKKLSPHQRKNITHLEFDIVDMESLINYQYQEDLIALLKDGYHFHVFLNKEPGNRLDHLKLIKIFDETFSTEKTSHMMVSKANEQEFNFNEYMLLPSPIDQLKDLEYLVKYPELRRSRASRAIIPIRLLHLPIDHSLLQLTYDEIIESVQVKIDKFIKEEQFRSIFLKLSVIKTLDISWYYHILLIGSKDTFLAEVDEQSKGKIESLLEMIEEIETLDKIDVLSHQ